jgi:AhpD family alkylhydroperoxidase
VTPRIAPGRARDTGLLVQGLARLFGRVSGTTPPHVFTTLGRHRRVFWGWLLFAGSLMPFGRLPRVDSEMVILRVATLRDSAYELTQHRRLARRAGLSADDVERVAAGPDADGWTARQALLLRATDALVRDQDLVDGLWAELRATLSERDCLELVMLVAHYGMLATVLGTLRVEPDRPR